MLLHFAIIGPMTPPFESTKDCKGGQRGHGRDPNNKQKDVYHIPTVWHRYELAGTH